MLECAFFIYNLSMLDTDKLYEKLIRDQSIKDIPFTDVMRVAFVVIDALKDCIRKEEL